MQFCRSKSLLNAYAWWCHDSCKMWGWNMITDKCRNDMFIMMLWRDAYAMHDMNAFYGHESPENYLFLLAHLCFVEENARMSKHENKWYAILQIKKFVERICMMMPWLMQNVRLEYDNGQMQERYVHYDVMKRCLCDAWYECILRTREPGKLSLLTCAFGGAVPHVYN